MAMSVGRPRSGAIAEINVTPMADVMIVLLIIFMVMTPIFVNAPVQLPDARQAAEQKGERLEVVLNTNGLIRAGQETFSSAEAFGDYLAVRSAGGPGPTVLILADRGVAYTEVARVLAACRKAGTREVGLAARRQVGS
jgi:biopolymer transport protein ExbD